MARTSSSVSWISFFIWISALGRACGEEMADVVEGEEAHLSCRFSPVLSSKEPEFFWTRTGPSGEKDMVAIRSVPLATHYRIDFIPSEGKYDLFIKGATYERDNGRFECMVKEGGTGRDFYNKAYYLTVLLPPGPPVVTPGGEPLGIEGKEMKLSCSSLGGSPDPQVTWYRVGEDSSLASVVTPGGRKDQATTAVLTINPRREDDGAEFRCVVWNRALPQKSLETTVRLRVHYFPRVTVGPANPVRVEEGGSVRLSCSVDSKPPATRVRWLQNGRVLGQGLVHTLEKVQLEDAGTYTCQAYNGLESTGEGDVLVDVLYGPIVSLPKRREVQPGQGITVQCLVDSNPLPSSIEWLKEGDPEFRQRGAELVLPVVTAEDVGTYTCRALVSFAVDSPKRKEIEREGNGSVLILVNHRPGRATIRSEPEFPVAGEPVTLVCDPNPPGWPEPVIVWWKDDGNPENPISNGGNFTLPGPVLGGEGEGVYHCLGRNSLGEGTPASYALDLGQKPRISSPLPPQVVKGTDSPRFSLNCSATGKPEPEGVWLKGGEEIPSGSPLYGIREEAVEGRFGVWTVKSELVFYGRDRSGDQDRLSPSDRGSYTCLFRNQVGSDKSYTLLRIQHAPLDEGTGKKVAGTVGSSAVLQCRVRSFPQPTFSWSFQDNPLVAMAGSKYESNSSNLEGDVHVGMFHIQSITPGDYGLYTCHVQNSLGGIRLEIRLQGHSSPDPPEPPVPVSTGPTWILLEWEPGFDGGLSDSLGFMVSADPQDDPRAERKEFDCQNHNPCNITNLRHQTAYLFRVRAFNAKGESEFSASSRLSTELNFEEIPSPVDVVYGKNIKTLAFSFLSSPFDLEAVVETKSGSGWEVYDRIPLDRTTRSRQHDLVMDLEGKDPSVRVSLCLQGNQTICGRPTVAEIEAEMPVHMLVSKGFPKELQVTIGVCALAFLAAILIVICILRRKVNGSKGSGKDYELENSHVRPNLVTGVGGNPPPPYYPGDTKSSLSLYDPPHNHSHNTSTSRNGYPGYSYPAAGNGHLPNGSGYGMGQGPGEEGGEGSEDSLWKGKLGTGDHGNGAYTLHAYDGAPSRGQGTFRGYDDYVTYPPSAHEEYLNQRNRQLLPFSSRNPLHDDDLNGGGEQQVHYHLPDPLLDGSRYVGSSDMGAGGDRTQQVTMSFEESFDSVPGQGQGHMTPTSRHRRVIHEVIV